uniref:Eukaryotic translation initiation factor 2 subunit 1 n=1 Tax=Branchiostoma floridae TaxID=7739 RepID=C3Y166_BRAFL|eukprot:XP_002609596.1 hypothetical protein BRAFLDRAFT_115066 [Branchiostoma floridae]
MAPSCRFYAKRFPQVDEVIMVNVRSIAEMGAYVSLLEYNNIEGMILLSELSRRRIRSINKLIRVGRNECVVVIRVDEEKGYIDLSKRRVSQEEMAQCEEKFAKAKAVNSILRHVAHLLEYQHDEQLEDLYVRTAWAFDDEKPGSAYEMFKKAVSKPPSTGQVPVASSNNVYIEVACYGYEGIDAVKGALRKGLALTTEDMPIKINLIAPPLYVMTTQTLERTEGVLLLQKAINAIKEDIEEGGGVFNVQMAPKVVTDTEEMELAKQLEKLEAANREVDGDDDYDEEETK